MTRYVGNELDGQDAELVARMCRGELEPAQVLYERHGRALFRFAVAMVGCLETAEDVVHDSFVQLMQRPSGFDPLRGNLTGYLLGTARNQISRVFRRRARTETVEPAKLDFIEAAPVDAGAAQDIRRLRAAILALPLAHREIIVLCDLEELPYAAVADIIQCPVGTVRSRLHRARALLGSYVNGDRIEAGAPDLPSSDSLDTDAIPERSLP